MKIIISQENSSPIEIDIADNKPAVKSNESIIAAIGIGGSIVIASWLAAVGLATAAIVKDAKLKNYNKLSEFLNDPDLHKLLSEVKDKMSKKGLRPIPISELNKLSDEEIKQQVKLISRYTAQNARDKVIGYHSKDIVPGFGTILYAVHQTINGCSENIIRCTLYGCFKDDKKGKISIKPILYFKLKHTNEAFDVSFSNNIR